MVGFDVRGVAAVGARLSFRSSPTALDFAPDGVAVVAIVAVQEACCRQLIVESVD